MVNECGGCRMAMSTIPNYGILLCSRIHVFMALLKVVIIDADDQLVVDDDLAVWSGTIQ